MLFSILAGWTLSGSAYAYDWLQFQFSPDKTGNNTLETTINASNVSQLKQLFKVSISDSPDGAPVLLTGVSTPAGVKDLIFVQGYHGALTAYDAHNGSTVWSKTFGGAGNSAPAIDLNRKYIYVNSSSTAHKINVGDGSEVTGGGWPETTGSGKSSSQLTVAMAKDGHEYLYCANQGHACVTTINLDTGTQHVFNMAASDQPDTHSPNQTQSGANPWSRAIPYDSSLDLVFEMGGTNNGSGWTAGKLWRQSWVALPADGHTTVSGGLGWPADSYTPTNWSATVSSDQDIGSGGLGILPVGLSSKYPHLGVQPGKDHSIRILNLADMSGQGGPGHLGGELFFYSFPAMSMMRSEVCIWTNPADGQVWAFTPGHNGIAGFKVMIDGSGNPSLVLAWSDVFSSVHFNTSAFVANNVLYAATGGGEHTSAESPHQINAMDPTTGTVLWSGAIDQFHWTSPILANGILYMADGPAGGFGSGAANLTAWSLGNVQQAVADPTFTPPAGNYSSAQSVAISTATSGASINYTTDGSIPSETAGTLYSGTPVTISSTTTLKAIAYKSGLADSNVVVGNYTIGGMVAAAPTFSPPGGSYGSPQMVSISTTSAGTTIRYTTDGSTPTETNGTLYTGPISVTADITLEAIAYGGGFLDSSISTASYLIGSTGAITYEAETSGHTTSGPLSSVQTDKNSSGGEWIELESNAVGQYIEFNIGTAGGGAGPILPAGTYQLQMEWKGNNNRGILQLSVDGSPLGSTLDQYASGQSYPTTTFGTVNFPTADNHIIRLAVTGKNSASSGYFLSADKFVFTPVQTQSQVAAPVFSPAGGTYSMAQNVAITSATPGASIRYTTDGSAPSETNGTVYSGPVNVSASETLQAIAYESGLTDSTVTSASYTIGSGNPPPTLNFEAESLSYTGSGATTSVQTDANSSGGKWVELAGNSVGDSITFTVPNVAAGTYQLKMEWKGNNSRGILQLAVDGANVGSTLDQYASGQTYPTTTFGNVTFSTTGSHAVRLTVTGKNSKSSSYQLSADKFTFVGQ
ncbi:MAG TPA: chitobiase/beta-hexosaminidase C-terminal domain-containing protein [Opitutaceae bacterium]|nr:chitobiase/beta-hexosaminidase C-terminal domain-containing protein [Opitutaceae bacterium]